MRFEFATATRIIFGRGTQQQLPQLCSEHGHRVLMVTGRSVERVEGIRKMLEAAGLSCGVWAVAGEPTVEDIERGVSKAREAEVDLVVAIGGGSAVDAGKAIAAMVRQPESLFEYLEVIGKAQPLVRPPLPFIAVPTTAGTGAEVTRNAVLASLEHGVKVSLRHPWMLPTMAVVDPELAKGCPPEVTAASGMDALTQCLEAYVSCRAQPMTDALCMDGIARAAGALEKAVTDGADLQAREDLALAALFSGMALANAGLGAVHGFAAAIGGSFKAPHGAVCAALLAPVWAANLRAVEITGAPNQIDKFHKASRLVTGSPNATPADAVLFLGRLTERLAIPRLRTHGIKREDFASIVTKAAAASSMKGNPVPLSEDDLMTILQQAWRSQATKGRVVVSVADSRLRMFPVPPAFIPIQAAAHRRRASRRPAEGARHAHA